jgi:hypothetical protein
MNNYVVEIRTDQFTASRFNVDDKMTAYELLRRIEVAAERANGGDRVRLRVSRVMGDGELVPLVRTTLMPLGYETK